MSQVLFAFLLTLLAGLATGIGGAISFFAPRFDKKFLSVSLGFSAGVMIYISFFELVPNGLELLHNVDEQRQRWIYLWAFFGGILLTYGLDLFIPHENNLKNIQIKYKKHSCYSSKKLLRLGIVMAFVLALHNIPEGMATFFSALEKPKIGYIVAIAIAFHNIPEGIIVAIPVYYATLSRKKAFVYSVLSGLTEPLGALIGYIFLSSYLSDTLVGIILIGIGGIMIYISLSELLPTAYMYGKHRFSVLGLLSGMFLMAISLIIF